MRKQMPSITNTLDAKIEEYLPVYYSGLYKLEVTEDAEKDLPQYINNYISEINHDNETQGQAGHYFEGGIRSIATIRSILLRNELQWDDDMMDSLILAVSNTLLISKENIRTKLDAISLLIFIVLHMPEHYKRNHSIFEALYDRKNDVKIEEHAVINSNIDSIALEIGLCFLYEAMGKDVAMDVLELLPYVQNDTATIIAIEVLWFNYLESDEKASFTHTLNAIVLQNILQWLKSDFLDERYVATKILLAMARNSENENIVNRLLINLIDSECVYIKNYILQNIKTQKGIWDTTKQYIISKCENDACFAVRMLCERRNE